MTVHFKISYLLQGKLEGELPPEDSRSFSVFSAKGRVSLRLLDAQTIEALYCGSVSQQLLDQLRQGELDIARWSSDVAEELGAIRNRIRIAATRLMYGLKFYLGHHEVAEGLATGQFKHWSEDGEEWKPLPGAMLFTDEYVGRSTPPFDVDASRALQQFLDNDEQLFPFALRHLHQARNTDSLPHKWVQAASAAELAIKEFLIRQAPAFRTLLVELPSPPMRTMYGTVLESVIGEQSPKRNQIHEGSETRNHIIHKPQQTKHEITRARAEEYIENVELAIYHLLRHALPEDVIIRRFYESRTR